ncbi:hypothetical protein [Peribacillus frigoritolerans]|uniref:hypothetical protein n=1 Tax=Peribacillus frigoritolerans TaxID=450367 RepID=UPI00105A4778|nr:hypothetical protein [Peribacillus frigoritolerans]TDL82098.1 hypothetical protein E2R53_00470 [Peribacillus frigoritolerans]
MAIHCNSDALPFQIVFKGNNYKEDISHVWSDYSINRDELISVGENLPTGIQFFVEDENDFDENAYIRVETSLYDELEEQEVRKIPLSNNDDNIEWFYRAKDQEVYPWRMGIYIIEVVYKGERYFTGFMVEPLHLLVSQVQWIHDYLEKSVEGIIYDFIYSNNSLSKPITEDLSSYWYYDYARFIQHNKQSIIFSLFSIERDPSKNVIGTNIISNIPGKVDSKSQRWFMTSKGIAKNLGLQPYVYHNNKKKILLTNNKENQWLKDTILLWMKDLNIVQSEIVSDYSKLVKDIHTEEVSIKQYEASTEKLFTKRDVAKPQINQMWTKIKIAKQNIHKYKVLKKTLGLWKKDLETIQDRFSWLLTHAFLSDVDRGKSKPILKKHPYRVFSDLFNESKKIQKNEGDKKKYVPILKPTWKIFEYFCLFKVMEILKEDGYTLTEGITQNFINVYNQEGIPEGKQFIMENKNSIIHIWFDKYLAFDDKEAEERDENFYSFQDKRRPDIKLDYYHKQDDETYWFRDSFVMDSKYRKMKSLYKSSYFNTTKHQLSSYSSIFYRGENTFTPYAHCVSRVVCLYSKDSNNEVLTVNRPFTFIQLYPELVDDFDEFRIIGHIELSNTMHEWIEGRNYSRTQKVSN